MFGPSRSARGRLRRSDSRDLPRLSISPLSGGRRGNLKAARRCAGSPPSRRFHLDPHPPRSTRGRGPQPNRRDRPRAPISQGAHRMKNELSRRRSLTHVGTGAIGSRSTTVRGPGPRVGSAIRRIAAGIAVASALLVAVASAAGPAEAATPGSGPTVANSAFPRSAKSARAGCTTRLRRGGCGLRRPRPASAATGWSENCGGRAPGTSAGGSNPPSSTQTQSGRS
jgi:hypothetical protein